MKVRGLFNRRIGATVMLAAVAGCSGGGSPSSNTALPAPLGSVPQANAYAVRARPPAMVAQRGTLQPASDITFGAPELLVAKSGKSSVYAGEFDPSQANLYILPDTKNAAPQCTIATSYVNDIDVDAAGTLWIPQGQIDRVTTYVKGTCTPAPLTLAEPNGQPIDIAFSSAGTVYVDDIFNKSGGPGLVSVYAKGASSPSSTLTDPSIEEADGIATNKAGDVFVSTYHSSTSSSTIVEFKNARMPGKTLALSGIVEPIGLAFDWNQNLIAVDFHANLVAVYARPYQGAPLASFPTKGNSLYGKLDGAEKNIYVSNSTNGTIDVFAYPAGTYEYSISNGLTQADFVSGIAVDPSAKN